MTRRACYPCTFSGCSRMCASSANGKVSKFHLRGNGKNSEQAVQVATKRRRVVIGDSTSPSRSTLTLSPQRNNSPSVHGGIPSITSMSEGFSAATLGDTLVERDQETTRLQQELIGAERSLATMTLSAAGHATEKKGMEEQLEETRREAMDATDQLKVAIGIVVQLEKEKDVDAEIIKKLRMELMLLRCHLRESESQLAALRGEVKSSDDDIEK